jgi:predicted DNA-binding protein with PD1-like motif
MNAGQSTKQTIYALRLTPGMDLRREIEAFAGARGIAAGAVVTAVGSLARAMLRLAGKPTGTEFLGDFEIVALVGTLGPDGVHLHLGIADEAGRMVGGHLLEGCVVRTTVEVVLAAYEGLVFARRPDVQTGYKELVIEGPGRLDVP